MSTELPKKRGRRKKIVSESECTPKPTTSNSTSSKKTAAKKATEISHFDQIEPTVVKPMNVILYLKCSIREIDAYIHDQKWKTDNLTYDPKIPYDFVPFETNESLRMNLIDPTHANSPIGGGGGRSDNDMFNGLGGLPNPYVCAKCEQKAMHTLGGSGSGGNNASLNEADTQKIKELKLTFYKNDVPDKKVDCFWCTCPYDNESFHVLQYGSDKTILAHGSFCSPECGVAYLFKHIPWDDSAKMESYQLMNHFYGNITDIGNHNIKPAASPYYFLDKYYGNMTIQEFRRLSCSSNVMLCIDKPVTRVLPEIHEDHDRQFLEGVNTQTRGNYKVKKQSDKQNGPSRSAILRENFKGNTTHSHA